MKLKAKIVTLIMLIVIFMVGVVMLFLPSLSMERFYTFVKAFAYIYIPLIASIGGNSMVEKWKQHVDQN